MFLSLLFCKRLWRNPSMSFNIILQINNINISIVSVLKLWIQLLTATELLKLHVLLYFVSCGSLYILRNCFFSKLSYYVFSFLLESFLPVWCLQTLWSDFCFTSNMELCIFCLAFASVSRHLSILFCFQRTRLLFHWLYIFCFNFISALNFIKSF